MCTEDRLSVTPEKIVVQDKDNRGHFLQQWAAGAFHRYALHYYSYAELLHNKKFRGKEKQERITLMNIASNVHFTARLTMPWPIGHMK
jgi:hypothetical protein